jgi:hypothetical protein
LTCKKRDLEKNTVEAEVHTDATGHLQVDFHQAQAALAPCRFQWIWEFALQNKNDLEKK